MKQKPQTKINEEFAWTYNYHIQGGLGQHSERTHSRRVKICDPSFYNGSLPMHDGSQIHTSDCFIINGVLDKCDGNFIGDWTLHNCTDNFIFHGGYIAHFADLNTMRGTKISAVLNLMTTNQMLERGIDWTTIHTDLRSQGVHHVVHCPVDMNSPLNHEQVFEAVQRLHDLVSNKKAVVYVMSQSGRTTAPTVVLAYICLYKRVRDWESHHVAY